MNLYVFGPMTGIAEHNAPAFRAAVADLRERGHTILSPVELDEADGFDFSRELTRPEYLAYLRRDIAKIAEAMATGELDGGVGLPGWEQSEGATLEAHTIRSLGGVTLRYPDLAPLRHPGSDRFHAILTSLGYLHDRKQADYGRDDDPFANVRAATEWGMAGWVGAMVRATDKVRRLQSYARRGTLANEGVIDAFDDLAVYAVIGRVLFEEAEDGADSR